MRVHVLALNDAFDLGLSAEFVSRLKSVVAR